MTNKKIQITKSVIYGWFCPECCEWNDEGESNPAGDDEVECGFCGKNFIPEEE